MLSCLLIKLFAGAVLLLSLVQGTVITDPPGNGESMDIIYVPVMENDNISLYCFMSGMNTSWELLFNASDFTLNNTQMNFHISDGEAPGSNLTIISFIKDMDRIKLRCNVSNKTVTFQLGLPNLPSLNYLGILNYTEGDNFTINLANTTNDPFPPIITSVLSFYESDNSFGGQVLENNNMTYVADYNVTFNFVQRTQSGLYRLNVSNIAGFAVGEFILNVQYGPSGIKKDTEVFASIGENLTITAFTNISYGNPSSPFFCIWSVTRENITINITTSTEHYLIHTTGQLVIINVTSNDDAEYTFGCTNYIDHIFTNIILMIATTLPSSPLNFVAINISDTTAVLSWSAPNMTGVPSFTYYQLTIADLSDSTNHTIITTSETVYVVHDLYPNTYYNVSIVATAPFFEEGSDLAWLNFTTHYGLSAIRQITGIPVDGYIEVTVFLKHIGGYESALILVTCTDSNHNMTIHNIIHINDVSLYNSTGLGPIYAGDRYQCLVNVTNGDGNVLNNSIDLLSTEGIPSTPQVSYEVYSGAVTLIVRSKYPGFPSTDNSSFAFLVLVRNGSDIIYNMSHSYPQYNSSLNQTIAVELNEGMYSIEVRATNLYGTSGKANIESVQVAFVSSSLTSTSTMSITLTTDIVSSVTITTIPSPVTMTSVPSPIISNQVTMTSIPSPTVSSTSIPTDNTEGMLLTTSAVAGLAIGCILAFIIIVIILIGFCVCIKHHLRRQKTKDTEKNSEFYFEPAVLKVIVAHDRKESSITTFEAEVCSDPKSQKPDHSNSSSKHNIYETPRENTPLSSGIEDTTGTSADVTEDNNDTSCVVVNIEEGPGNVKSVASSTEENNTSTD